MDGRYFDFVLQQINAHGFRNGVYRMFGGAIHISLFVYFFGCRRTYIENMRQGCLLQEGENCFRNIQEAL